MSADRMAQEWLALLVNASVKSLLVFAAAGLALFLLRRASAATRHLVWVLALGSLMCLVPLSAALPSWKSPIPFPRMAGPRAAPLPQSGPGSLPGRRQPTPVPGANSPALRSPASPQRALPASWQAWVFLLWLCGAGGVFARGVLDWASLRRLHRGTKKITSGPLAALVPDLARRTGISRRVVLLLADPDGPPAPPMTWGWLRPVVLLPAEAPDWPEDRLRTVLLHELAHVRRGDWLIQRLADLACSLYWFHPLVWLAESWLRSESERACDDRVLAAGIGAADYAHHLLEVIRTMRLTNRSVQAAVTMAHRPEIGGRIQAILEAGRDRREPTRRVLALALAAVALSLVPLAMLGPAATAAGNAGVSPPPRREGATQLAPQLAMDGKAMLPGGVTVELLGVTEALSPEQKWWSPGGKLLVQPPFDPRDPVVSQRLQLRNEALPTDLRQGPAFAVRLSHSLPGRIGTHYQFLPGADMLLLYTTDLPIQLAMKEGLTTETRVLGAAFSEPVDRCTLRYGIGAGPWRRAATAAPDLKEVKSMDAGPVAFEWVDRPPAPDAGSGEGAASSTSRLRVTDSLGHVDRRVVAVDGTGKEIELPGGVAMTKVPRTVSMIVELAGLKPGQVKEYRLEIRPYEWAEFRDIHLKPQK
jgi:beta-lactamase regulating signal transducer with metallopeptidase domain